MRGAWHTSNMTVYVGREPGELDVLTADRQGACVVLDHGPPRRANSQFSGEAPSLAPASSPCNYLFGASHRWTGYGRLGRHLDRVYRISERPLPCARLPFDGIKIAVHSLHARMVGMSELAQ